MNFCTDFGLEPIPISDTNLCRYAAYLAGQLAYSSIGKYLNIIRILHLEYGMDNPLKDNWALSTMLKGIKRIKGAAVVRKLPITPDLLLKIRSLLNLDLPVDIVFWAACLVAFFGLLRQNNLFPGSGSRFFLRKKDVRRHKHGLLLSLSGSKTVQFRERCLSLPLPCLDPHPLCPVRALASALRVVGVGPGEAPLFSGSGCDLSRSKFVQRLHSLLQAAGVHPTMYSGHSFRRGGASWAFEAGLPGEFIQILGDWRSDAYLRYLSLNTNTKFKLMRDFSISLPST